MPEEKSLEHRTYLPFRTTTKRCDTCDNLAEWTAEGKGFRVDTEELMHYCRTCLKSELTEEHDARRVVYQAINKLTNKELRERAFRHLRATDDGPVREICEEWLQEFLEIPGYYPKWDIEEERKQAKAEADKPKRSRKKPKAFRRGADGQLLPSKPLSEVKSEVDDWMEQMISELEEEDE